MASFSAWFLQCDLLSYYHLIIPPPPEIGTVCHLHIVKKVPPLVKYAWEMCMAVGVFHNLSLPVDHL